MDILTNFAFLLISHKTIGKHFRGSFFKLWCIAQYADGESNKIVYDKN